MSINNSLPIRLYELRKKNGLTLKELGIKFELTESTMSKYEKGHRFPDQETLVGLADFFKVSTDYLLGRIDTPLNNDCFNNEYEKDDLINMILSKCENMDKSKLAIVLQLLTISESPSNINHSDTYHRTNRAK